MIYKRLQDVYFAAFFDYIYVYSKINLVYFIVLKACQMKLFTKKIGARVNMRASYGFISIYKVNMENKM